MIDIRSDKLTRAPEPMLKIMSEAKCQNNNTLDDLETIQFEQRLAKMFNKEASIFFVTASMANLAAVILHTKPGSEVIISSTSHSVERQSASFARVAGVQLRQINTESGLISQQQIRQRIRKSTQHVTFPDTDLLFLENGTFRGRVWEISVLKEIKKMAEDNKVAVHIDGARIFNALATYGLEPSSISDLYDTMTLSFTKGFCCPIGAAILGSVQHIKRLKNIRKSLGGGMMHTSILTNGIGYALDHLIPEFKRDNEAAIQLARELSTIPGVRINVQQTQINMVYWSVTIPNFDHKALCDYLISQGIRIKQFDEDINAYRFVTHFHIRKQQVDLIADSLRKYFNSLIQ